LSAVKERVDAGWDFTFLGADQDAIQEGGSLGVDPDSSLTYDKSAFGSRAAMSSLSRSVSRRRSGESTKLGFTDDERRRSSGG
jgi:hypothetical protein